MYLWENMNVLKKVQKIGGGMSWKIMRWIDKR